MVKNFFDRHYRAALWVAYAFGLFANVCSSILVRFNPHFEGLMPYGGSEEAMYLIRTQEALLHPFTNVTNGVWSGVGAPYGLQSAGTEQLIGSLLWWTHFPAPWLVLVLHVLIVPLILPLSAALARRVGASKPQALLCSLFLFWMVVYGRRLFHPGFSLPLVLGTLVLLWRWYERPTALRAGLLGLLLGFSMGVYLWAWTFLWTTVGLVFCAAVVDRRLPHRMAMLRTAPWLAIVTAIAAWPAFSHLLYARLSPFYAETSVRVGLAHTHAPESWPRSVLLVCIAAAAVWMLRRKREFHALLPLLAVLVSLAIMYNQQLVHGMVMSFSSHYIHYVTFGLFLLIVTLAVRGMRTPLAVFTCAACVIILFLNKSDVGGRDIAFLPPPESAMKMQHLASAVTVLQAMPKTTFLSDRLTADIIASYTAHDVAFTEYSAFLLTSDNEYIERACLSELFAPTAVRYDQLVVHAEEHLRVLRKQEANDQYVRSLAAADKRCAEVRANPLPLLTKYGVTHLLWDSQRLPDWKIDERLFKKLSAGEGWSLWQLRP